MASFGTERRFSGCGFDGRRCDPQAPPQPPTWRSVVRRLRQYGIFSMKHQIITTDLRTDLMVATIAVGALAAFSAIGFMFTFVIAL